jgi:hypothetical protein
VDGSNPAPVNRWCIPLFLGLQPSKVMQEFFHPQYVHVLKSLIIDGQVLRSKHATDITSKGMSTYSGQKVQHFLKEAKCLKNTLQQTAHVSNICICLRKLHAFQTFSKM